MGSSGENVRLCVGGQERGGPWCLYATTACKLVDIHKHGTQQRKPAFKRSTSMETIRAQSVPPASPCLPVLSDPLPSSPPNKPTFGFNLSDESTLFETGFPLDFAGLKEKHGVALSLP